MDFRKVIYENVGKNTFISKPTYLYIRTIDILKFYFVCIVKVCFFFKNSRYAYFPLYKHKTLQHYEMRKDNSKLNLTKSHGAS